MIDLNKTFTNFALRLPHFTFGNGIFDNPVKGCKILGTVK